MDNIKTWLKIIENNNIHANNKVSTADVAVCINFLQIPDTEVVIVTITMMKNKSKRVALDVVNFAKAMSCMEDALSTVEGWCDENHKYNKYYEYFQKHNELDLSKNWFIQLCCHRVFFVPDFSLWKVIESMFCSPRIKLLKSLGLYEISVLVNTDNYDFNTKFY